MFIQPKKTHTSMTYFAFLPKIKYAQVKLQVGEPPLDFMQVVVSARGFCELLINVIF